MERITRLSRVLWAGIMVFLCMASSCKKPIVTPPAPDSKYLFLSHLRAYDGSERVAPEVESLDLSGYDALLLGGDLTLNTSMEEATLIYIDSLFGLDRPNTLWTLGNHDYDNPGLISQYTERPGFYSYHHNHITFVVLDTQRDSCNIEGAQLDFLRAVTDTLDRSQQLVILHHKLIWMPDNAELEPEIRWIANAGLCNIPACIFRNNFYPEIYPILESIRDRGIEVILIGGDAGVKKPYFYHLQGPDIHFLANGIKDGKDDNKAILLTKNGETGQLTWELVGMEEI